MATVYETEIEVRGYELDSFQHVNHAQFISYCEHARWKFLEAHGITLKTLHQWGRFPVIAEVQMKYLKPAYLGDILKIQSQILSTGKTNLIFRHDIIQTKHGEKIAEAQMRVVFVDETGKPAKLPEAVEKLGIQS